MTPLEIGAIVAKFLSSHEYKVFLKWPNDLLNFHGKKCGGILCNFPGEEWVIAGIGLNVGKLEETSFLKAGTLDNERILTEVDKKEWPAKIYHHILDHRLAPEEVLNVWSNFCFHQNKEVKVTDGKESFIGTFEGITHRGEALVGGRSFSSGSLELFGTIP